MSILSGHIELSVEMRDFLKDLGFQKAPSFGSYREIYEFKRPNRRMQVSIFLSGTTTVFFHGSKPYKNKYRWMLPVSDRNPEGLIRVLREKAELDLYQFIAENDNNE